MNGKEGAGWNCIELYSNDISHAVLVITGLGLLTGGILFFQEHFSNPNAFHRKLFEI